MSPKKQRVILMGLSRSEIQKTFEHSAQLENMLSAAAFCFKEIHLVCFHEEVFHPLGLTSKLFVLEHELAHLVFPSEWNELNVDSLAFQHMKQAGDHLQEIELEKILVNDTIPSRQARLLNFNMYLQYGQQN